jgi:hypothetical protein
MIIKGDFAMKDFKSVQDLIVKAAFYDGVSTTINASPLYGTHSVLQLTFSKGDRQSTTHIDISPFYKDTESIVLYECKRALYELLMSPYDQIKVYDGEVI